MVADCTTVEELKPRELVAEADGTMVIVVVGVIMAVSVEVAPETTVVDVNVTGTVVVTMKGVEMGTMAVAVEVVATTVDPVVQTMDETVVVEPDCTIVDVTVTGPDVVSVMDVTTGTSVVVLMAMVTPATVVLDISTGTDVDETVDDCESLSVGRNGGRRVPKAASAVVVIVTTVV